MPSRAALKRSQAQHCTEALARQKCVRFAGRATRMLLSATVSYVMTLTFVLGHKFRKEAECYQMNATTESKSLIAQAYCTLQAVMSSRLLEGAMMGSTQDMAALNVRRCLLLWLVICVPCWHGAPEQTKCQPPLLLTSRSCQYSSQSRTCPADRQTAWPAATQWLKTVQPGRRNEAGNYRSSHDCKPCHVRLTPMCCRLRLPGFPGPHAAPYTDLSSIFSPFSYSRVPPLQRACHVLLGPSNTHNNLA